MGTHWRALVAVATSLALTACGGGGGPSSGPSPVPWSPGLLNDTGISSAQCHGSGDSQGQFFDCGSSAALQWSTAQDGSSGRDAVSSTNLAADGKLGFSFTKIDVDGQPLPSYADSWTCVRDEVTGLLWEVKTADGGLRDANKTYTNFTPAFDPGKQHGTPTDAAGYVAAVNTASLCGTGDWRLPTAHELQGIVDYGAARQQISIDTAFFPNTVSDRFWTGTPFTRNLGLESLSWFVLSEGGSSSWIERSTPARVRLVRAEPPAVAVRWTYSADGQQVTDNLTRLTWRRCSEGMTWSGTACTGVAIEYPYDQAIARARDQAAATSSPWRVPNVKELFSLVDTDQNSPAIDSAVFPATFSWYYWTSTPYPTASAMVWVLNFSTGGVGPQVRYITSNRLRLVRDSN